MNPGDERPQLRENMKITRDARGGDPSVNGNEYPAPNLPSSGSFTPNSKEFRCSQCWGGFGYCVRIVHPAVDHPDEICPKYNGTRPIWKKVE